MRPFPLPEKLVERARTDKDPKWREWVEKIPEIVAAMERRWGLELDPPFQPGGSTAWVAPARDAAGQERVLKVGWPHEESDQEADGLREWAGRGTALLHAAHRDGETSALLLERARPGAELGQSLPEEEQDDVVAGLLRRLRLEPGPGHPFRPLQQMCDRWADEYEAALNPDLDPGLGREGVALFRSLPSSADRHVLLVTDLHGGNVLAAEREPWLVIDPKPFVGDPAYDPLQHLLNCSERLTSDPAALAGRMADLCDVDRERLRLWLFARCVIESTWWPDMAEVARRLAPR